MEHMFSHFVFMILQIKLIYDFVKNKLSSHTFNILIRYFIFGSVSGLILIVVYLAFTGKTEFSDRVLTLIDPNYAKKFIPIVASVSEHQSN